MNFVHFVLPKQYITLIIQIRFGVWSFLNSHVQYSIKNIVYCMK